MKTYREWNALGFRINKGARAVGFRDGEPLFERWQTYQPSARRYLPGDDPDPGGEREYDGGGFWGDLHDAERW